MDNHEDVALTFGRNDKWSTYEVIKTCICAVFLLPFRLCALLLANLIYGFIVRIATIGISNENLLKRPIPAHRKKIINLGRFFGRICLYALGFWRIKVNGLHNLKDKSQKVNVYIANHSSWIDILALLCLTDTVPSFVSKKSVEKIPIIGHNSRAWQCIYVDRLSHREGAGSTLKERATDFSMPPVVVFPEGTTSNGKQLIKFHTGGFLSGAPVRPIILRYPYKHFSPSWESISAIRHLFRIMTQFSNYLEVTFLPVYVPSAEEKSNPELYAKRVQKLMADYMKIPVKDYSYQAKVDYLRSMRSAAASVY